MRRIKALVSVQFPCQVMVPAGGPRPPTLGNVNAISFQTLFVGGEQCLQRGGPRPVSSDVKEAHGLHGCSTLVCRYRFQVSSLDLPACTRGARRATEEPSSWRPEARRRRSCFYLILSCCCIAITSETAPGGCDAASAISGHDRVV